MKKMEINKIKFLSHSIARSNSPYSPLYQRRSDTNEIRYLIAVIVNVMKLVCRLFFHVNRCWIPLTLRAHAVKNSQDQKNEEDDSTSDSSDDSA